MAEKTATFALNLESNAGQVSGAATAELEALRSKIEASQGALKGMSGALRALRGSSDEVAAAKSQLKAKIDAEKGTISQATLALLKHGAGFQKVTKEVKGAKTAEEKLREGIKAAGGPVATLTEKFDNLKGVLGGVHGKTAALALGVGTLVLGVAALTAATVEAGIKLGKFLITSANSLRSMQLMREAVAGGADNAKALGTQVDLMSRKVATSKVELNNLAVAITKSLSGGMSKAGGQAIVDTFAAVSQAAAAAGDDTGQALRDIIERGKLVGRIWTNPLELQGKGIQFQDIAGGLAKNLHIGLDQAKAALFEGRVSLGAGAAALRTAVEDKWGKINAAKLLDVDVQIDKLHEHLVGLTKGVVLEPLLKGMDRVLQQFDETTVTGKSVQLIFTKAGEALTDFAVAHVGDVVKGVEALVLGGLKAVVFFQEWAPKIKGASDALSENKALMEGLKVVAVGVGVGLAAVGTAVALAAGAVAGTAAMIGAPIVALYEGYKFLAALNWGKIGEAVIDGLVKGITGGIGRAVDAVKNLATRVKDAFVGKAGIDAHSPSKFFEKGGRESTEGYAQGVQRAAPRAQDSVQAMARDTGGGSTAAAARRATGGQAGPVTINVTINLPEGMKYETAQANARAMSSPSVLRELVKAVRQGMVTQGIPTQTAVPT